MSRSVPPDDDTVDYLETLSERAARYWQRSAKAYKAACSAETPEVKKLYMEIAMSWASLANEVERGGPFRVLPASDSHAKH